VSCSICVRVCLMCAVTFACMRDVQLLLKDMIVLLLLNLKNDCNGFMCSHASRVRAPAFRSMSFPFSEMGTCARSV
jgi:hypothetical protein